MRQINYKKKKFLIGLVVVILSVLSLVIYKLNQPEKLIIYQNNTFKFSFLYPSDFTTKSLGNNYSMLQVNDGQIISGTVQPSFDTIEFYKNGVLIFDVEIFFPSNQSLLLSDFDKWPNNYLYLNGKCDGRWVDVAAKAIKNFQYNNILFLKTESAGPYEDYDNLNYTKSHPIYGYSYVGCYYFKNKNGNLIVMSTDVYKDKQPFLYAESVIERILPRLKLF